MRHDSKLYVTVKFPVSPHSKPLSLSYSVPVNDTSDHATQILDLPEFFALTHDTQFYTTFNHADFSSCTRNCLGRAGVCDCGTPWTFLLHFFSHLNCYFNKALSPATQETCIMTLCANNKDLINKYCDFRVLLNHFYPQIVEINKSSILVYKSPNLGLDCKSGKRMMKCSIFCTLSIPL